MRFEVTWTSGSLHAEPDEVEIGDLDALVRFVAEAGHPVIIFTDGSLEVYDSFRE